MSENVIDTLSLEIKSDVHNADAAIDRLCNSLYHLDSTLMNTSRNGARNFQAAIIEATSSLRDLVNLAAKPIKLNFETSSSDGVSRMKHSLEKALSDTKLDTSKIASQLADSFSITSKTAISNIDRQLQSIVEHFVDSFDGGALKLSKSALDGLVESISQSAKIAKSNLSYAFDGIEQEYEEFYNYFKNKKIYISDFLKNDIGKSEFKSALESNLSNITRNAGKGVDLNSIWGELSQRFPTIISPDTVNAADQVLMVLEKINEARNKIKPVSVQTLFGEDYASAIKRIQESTLGAINEAKGNLANKASGFLDESGRKINLDIEINEEKIVTDIQSAIRKASKVKYSPVSVELDIDASKIKNALTEKLKSIDIGNIPQLSAGIKQISDSLVAMSGINVRDSGINIIINSINRLNRTMGTASSGALSMVSSEIGSLAQNLNVLNGIKFDATGISGIANAISLLGRKNIATAAQNIPFLTVGLSDFVNSLNKIGTISFDVSGLSELVSSITKLGGKTASAAVPNIDSLAKALKNMMVTLSTAPRVSQNLIQMAQAMAQLANNGNRVSNMNVSLASGFGKINSMTGKTQKKVFSLAAAFGKFYATYWLILRVFRLFKRAIDISSDLTEVQNVVDVTFGNMKQKVEDLAATSIQDFGMSELTVKQIASRFQAMGVAMGFSQTQMSDMSVELTKLAADMASFYNVEQNEVAKSLESVFTGQTVPLRKYGLDLTQATVKEWAMKQGLDANMASMTQAQKTMLRYQYVLANTTAAQGDFARTADTWHNSLVRLSQSFKQIGGIVGGALINSFKPFISALNSVMQSVLKFTETVVNALGVIFGWKIEINAGGLATDFESIGDAAEEIEDGTGGASKNLEKMNKYVAGWNEVNNMTTSDNSGGGGGGGSGGVDDFGDALETQLQKTESIFDVYKSEIDNLYDLGKYISNALAGAMNSIDWNSVYQGARNFGSGLAEFLNGLISPELFSAVGHTISGAINTAIYTALSFGQTFDFSNLGTSLAFAVNSSLMDIDWYSALTAAETWGEGIADTINSFLQLTNFNLVGSTIANALNTSVQYALSLGMNIDWTELGNSISESANGFFSTFNFTNLAETINNWAKGILDMVITALDNTNWDDIGTSIGTFLETLDFTEIAGKVVEALWKAISAGFQVWGGIFDAAPIETTILTAVAILEFTSIGHLVGLKIFTAIFDGLKVSAAGYAVKIGATIASWFGGTTLVTTISATMAETGASLPTVLFNLIWVPIKTFFTVTVPGLFSGVFTSIGTTIMSGLTTLAGTLGVSVGTAGLIVVAAVVAAVAAVVAAATHWDEITTFFTETIPNWWNGTVVPFFQGIPETLSGIWESVKQGAVEKLGQFTDYLSKIPDKVKNVITNISEWFDKLPEKIGYALGYALGTVVKWQTELSTFVVNEIPKIIANIVEWFAEMPDKIRDKINVFIVYTATWGVKVFDEFKKGVTNTITNVVNWFQELPYKIFAAIILITGQIGTWGIQVLNSFENATKNIIRSVITWFTELPQNIYDTIIKAKEKIDEWTAEMIFAFQYGIPMIINKVVDFFGDIDEKIVEVGENIIKGLWNGINNMVDWLGTKISGFVQGVIDGFKDGFDEHSPSKIAFEIGDYFTLGLENGIADRFSDIYRDIKNFTNNISATRIEPITFDSSLPKPNFSGNSYGFGTYQASMQMEMDARMAELEFENRQLRETMEQSNQILEQILEKGIVLDDNEFAKRYKSSATSFRRRTGNQLGVSY